MDQEAARYGCLDWHLDLVDILSRRRIPQGQRGRQARDEVRTRQRIERLE